MDKESRRGSVAVEMRGICKSFGQLRALDDVNLRVHFGEVHAILGENGAGKSTLMSILFGLKRADKGEIYIRGERARINNVDEATQLGIGMVHQHFRLVQVFSVYENIILGHEDAKFGFTCKKESFQRIQELSERYGMGLDLKAKVKDIPVSAQQKTEIMKVLYVGSDIIILDEPTAVLTPQEIDSLMKVIRRFADEGKAVILITHKLNEIKQVADVVTLLRRGRTLGTFRVSECQPAQLAELMVGRPVSFTVDKEDKEPGETVLSVRNLSCYRADKSKAALDDVSFDVHAGEVVGIAAIEGNGETELMDLVTGLQSYPKSHGQILFKGKDFKPTPKAPEGIDLMEASVTERIRQGISDIPADRQRYGLFLGMNIADNLISRSLIPPYTRAGFLVPTARDKHADELIKDYDIRSNAGRMSVVGDMSGGNQQKVIIARELEAKPSLLVSNQATRGLDVGAIEFVNSQIVRARDAGCAVLLYSTELEDIFNLATVILVLHNGKIVARLDPKKTDYREVGLYMGGGQEEPAAELIQEPQVLPALEAEEDQPDLEVELEPVESEEYATFRRLLKDGEDGKAAKHRLISLSRQLRALDLKAAATLGLTDLAEAPEKGRHLARFAKRLKLGATPTRIAGAKNGLSDAANADAGVEPTESIQSAIERDRAQSQVALSLKGTTPESVERDAKEMLKQRMRARSGRAAGALFSFLDSVVAILFGLVLGFIVMLLTKPSDPMAAVEGFAALFTSGARNGLQSVGHVLWVAAPLILVGLAVALPNKAGLFNIGGSGQFTIAASVALFSANVININNPILFWIVLVIAMGVGLVWAGLAGLMKAFLNVNEVVATIMLNWIAVFLNMIIVSDPRVFDVLQAAANFDVPAAFVPGAGLGSIFGYASGLNSSILFAIAAAIVIFVLLYGTKFGFKVRAVGLSRDASKYAGYSYRTITFGVMAIAGALAGMAAVFYYIPSAVPAGYSPLYQGLLQSTQTLSNVGFDGISVALIANNNPLGTILSGFMLGWFREAGNSIQNAGFDRNIVDLVMGVIIYSTAAVKLVSMLVRHLRLRKAIRAEERELASRLGKESA